MEINAPAPAQPEPRSAAIGAVPVVDYGFVTFDKGRKHLARVVADNGKKVAVRRFSKKTGEWQTKTESRERKACIPLATAEAEESFPGCVAAWDKAAQSPTESGGKVTRHLSRNSVPQAVVIPALKSVADLVVAYNAKKKAIDDLTGKFAEKAVEAKRAQDDLIPHLAQMQSLLSKKGAHHHLVIAARKQGHKIPWWTDYYESYRERLWECLRTMERRIAAYRNDPTERGEKRDTDPNAASAPIKIRPVAHVQPHQHALADDVRKALVKIFPPKTCVAVSAKTGNGWTSLTINYLTDAEAKTLASLLGVV